MPEQTEIALPQSGSETIASTPNHGLTPRSSRSSLSLSDEEANVLAQNTIVNSVTNSSKVNIKNVSKNVYNAPVVINVINNQQHDNIEQLPAEKSTVPETSFSKKFCSIYRSEVQQQCSTKYYIAIPVLLLIVVVLIISFIIWLFESGKLQQLQSDDTSNSTSEQNELKMVLRKEWNAKPPKIAAEPAALVIINHTRTKNCYFLEQCNMLVQRMQNDHMIISHDWNDIGYNFLVGGDGLVYDGRGWNVEGAHTLKYNRCSIGIGIIGTFDKEEPTKVQLEATQKLIEYGVKNGYISSDYKLLGHRQCRDGSGSPGDALYNIMKTWDHWSSRCPSCRF